MLLNWRRFIVMQALMLWQGGFLFYASVVVPAGTDVLGSAAAQGAITARVTDAMNLIAMAALAVIALDLSFTRDEYRLRKEVRWWSWGVALVCQLLLFEFHGLLDAFMDADRRRVVIGPPFRPVHRMYLWAITIQWFSCLLLAWCTLRAWQAEDSSRRDADASPPRTITG
jgi:hypothetical protein